MYEEVIAGIVLNVLWHYLIKSQNNPCNGYYAIVIVSREGN